MNKVPLGKVDFGAMRPGTFQTISFPLTDQVRNALAGAKFNDLSFEIALTQLEPGEYLLDNLRIRSTQGVTADATTKPPTGYGGSVDFDLNFNVNDSVVPLSATESLSTPTPSPMEQTFDVGPIQIPAQFHLKSGESSAGTSVQLDLGYSSTSLVTTCLYLADPNDKSLKNYVFSSCTGGSQPGDLISASWARLDIINGAAPMRLRAQLARRPLGDQVGTGIIPPMGRPNLVASMSRRATIAEKRKQDCRQRPKRRLGSLGSVRKERDGGTVIIADSRLRTLDCASPFASRSRPPS